MRLVLSFAVAALVLAGGAPRPATAQDASAGQKAFATCSACHSTDGSKKVGPTLSAVVGRKAGSEAGFRYSRAMKAANVTWDDKSLDSYIAAPQKFIPGNTMAFSGLPDEKKRADIIAYLNTLKK